jgi:hypothetical protein
MKHHHTGKIHHSDMVMLHGAEGMGGKDPHAHASHHSANKESGMPEGMSPKGEEHGEVGQMGGAPSESSNCEYS